MSKQEPEAIFLSPDGYSRFYVICRIIEQYFKGHRGQIRILDVGGCSPYLFEVLSGTSLDFSLTILDMLPKPKEMDGLGIEYIQGDATSSGVARGVYDVVVSTDTMEHIDKDKKDDFLKGCVAIAKELCIIAAPFETEGVDEAERLVNDFNKKLFGEGQPWLEEHFAYTKPNLEQSCKVLDSIAVEYEHFGTNNIYSWVYSSHLNLIQAKLGLQYDGMRRIYQSYNSMLDKSIEFTEPTYRHFLVAYKHTRSKAAPRIQHLFSGVPNSDVFAKYLHDMAVVVTDRLEYLNNHNNSLEGKMKLLDQQLDNANVYNQKLSSKIERYEEDLKKLAPYKVLWAFTHPHVAVKKAINKRRRK
jgi:hypothetical protein